MLTGPASDPRRRHWQRRPLAQEEQFGPALPIIRHTDLAFLPVLFTTMGLGCSVLTWVTPLVYPSSGVGLVIGIWFAIGLVVLGYLYARHP